jgi:hypothetical protein
MGEQTFWNGEPCEARKVSCVMADSPEFPEFWGRKEGYVGRRVDAVEVRYFARPFYLLDDLGQGWRKVTEGGSPSVGHKELRPEPGTLEERP